ncbi:MAG: hypothetical protein RL653_3520 [Pseudomonadota bacterium]|jgi:glycosyltransferase involved in cell wall biosynthesis
MNPVLSLVVPVYNLELYVQRCLQSLVDQTLADIEILAVDDGSTDDSPALIAEFAARDGRVRHVRKVNGGHGSACNAGIEQARGKYVVFVDGDDWLEPDTCAFMVERAEQTGADLVMGQLKYFFADGRTDHHNPLPLQSEQTLDGAGKSELFRNWATPNARLYRRTMFEDAAVRFLPGIIFADVNFCPKSYLAAQRIHYVPRPLYNYDLTRPTQSMKQTDKRVMNVVPSLRDMLAFYRAKGAFEPWRDELCTYTVRHCVSWFERVKLLGDMDRTVALRELMAVLDDHFGDGWTGEPLETFAGRRKALLIRAARALDYRPLPALWELPSRIAAADDRVERVLGSPLSAWQGMKQRVKSRLFSALSV